jgi:hypothetical protein
MTKFPTRLCLTLVLAAGACDDLRDVMREPPSAPPSGTPPLACTEIGCTDQLSATIRPKAGVFEVGTHRIAVYTAEGGPVRSCTLIIPDSSFTTPVSGSCSEGLEVVVSPRTKCTESTQGAVATSSCVPIPGQYEEVITLAPITTRLLIEQRVLGPKGSVVFQRELTPEYRKVQPNGPGCAPVCRQAQVGWETPVEPPASGVACAPSACGVSEDCAPLGGGTCIQRPWTGPCLALSCEKP